MSPPDDGARQLQRLIKQTGRKMTAAELAQLLAGVAVTPEDFSGPTWVDLIAPQADQDLRDTLVAARRKLATDSHGLDDHVPPADRLVRLREELRRRSLDGFLVPRSDEHQGEYVPAHSQRLQWLTGFSGSAGMAVVLLGKAAIFIDGRYTLQVTQQVDTALFAPQPLSKMPPARWLGETLKPGQRIGFDPWLHNVTDIERLAAGCRRAGAELVPVDGNPIDLLWEDQPPPPLGPVVPHDLAYAGVSSEAKRQTLSATMKQNGVDAAVLTLCDSIAWLLNLRGNDILHVPMPISFAILHADGRVDLFIDRRKVTDAALRHLGNAVALHPPEALDTALQALGRAQKTVQIDPGTAPQAVASLLQSSGARLVLDLDPAALPKASKNPVEIEGMRRAHLRDGAALTRFLAWLSREAPGGMLDEISAAERLQAFRRESDLCRDLSFDTISGAGPNGAIVHYRVTPKTNRNIHPGELYLVDSGAQYLDGTTDVTRTVAIGTPNAEMRDRFTRVLKGHIAIATCRFPAGTTGSHLDAMARRPLWQIGLDYEHGTGHGVGSYLSVHEGPHRISRMVNTVALRPGMVVSNEPGYYREGAYGIRIENLVVVQPAQGIAGVDGFLEFETLTRAPIDRALVLPALLTRDELDWLNGYHETVRNDLAPLVDAETAAWLAKATAPIEP